MCVKLSINNQRNKPVKVLLRSLKSLPKILLRTVWNFLKLVSYSYSAVSIRRVAAAETR